MHKVMLRAIRGTACFLVIGKTCLCTFGNKVLLNERDVIKMAVGNRNNDAVDLRQTECGNGV